MKMKAIIVSSIAVLSLSACNTVAGIGQDLQSIGGTTSKVAHDASPDGRRSHARQGTDRRLVHNRNVRRAPGGYPQ